MGSLRVGHDWRLHFHFSLSCIGEGKGSPLQYSCLENLRDRGALWAAVYGVAQSRTRLKGLSSSSSAYILIHEQTSMLGLILINFNILYDAYDLVIIARTPFQYSCLENPVDREVWWAVVHGVAKSWTQLSDFPFTFHFPLSCIGEGNGNPLQCSCLENPRDRGAWWASIYGVAQSRTRLKRLSNSKRNEKKFKYRQNYKNNVLTYLFGCTGS